jgi:hypothetical protein
VAEEARARRRLALTAGTAYALTGSNDSEDTVKLRSVTTALLLAATIAIPAGLQAQITTFVVPPRKAGADSGKPATVAEIKAKNDSITRMSITGMKEWVDSAAGVNTTVAGANDTTMASANAPASAPTSAAPNASGRTTTTFSNGAIAPNTASPLPAYLATGIASLSAGLALLLALRRRAASAKK